MFCTIHMQLSLLFLYILSLTTASAVANVNALERRFGVQSLQNTNLSLPLSGNASLATSSSDVYHYDDKQGRTIELTPVKGPRIARDKAIDLLMRGYADLMISIPRNHQAIYSDGSGSIFQSSASMGDVLLTLYGSTQLTPAGNDMTYNTLRVALQLIWQMILAYYPDTIPSVELIVTIKGSSDDQAVLDGSLIGTKASKSKS